MFFMSWLGHRARVLVVSCVAVLATLFGQAAFALPNVTLTQPSSNKTYGNPASVTLAATATPTAGSSITKVEFYRGTTLITIVNAPGPYTTTFNHNVNGVYSITAKAFDSTGNRTSNARTVTIAANVTPTVNLTEPSAGNEYTTLDSVYFLATASDNDGAVSKVEFFRGGSTLIGTVTTPPYELYATLPVGDHTITAKATDNSAGIKISSGKLIHVLPAPGPPTVSIASPVNGATFQLGSPIAFTATATAQAPAEVFQVEFFRGGSTLVGQVYAPPPLTATWTDAAVGTYSITARVMDNYGQTVTSAPITINVAAPLAPPAITLTSPVSGAVVPPGATVSITATANAVEPGASISKVEFFDEGVKLATVNAPPYTYPWIVSAGSHFITAKATDSLGTTATTPIAYVVVDGADSCDTAPPLTALDAATKLAAFGALPMTFEASVGQVGSETRFVSRGRGYQLFLTPTESVVALSDARADRGVAVRTRLLGANPRPVISGAEPVERKSNYFAGRDPSKWRRNVPNFAKVRYEAVYPGIDQVFYGSEGRVEYDLHVAAGADPAAIRFALEGADSVALDAEGNLVLETALGTLVQKRPVAYQEIAGERRVVAAAYAMREGEVGFELGSYDKSHPLVIDPVLVYSTYLGGSDDQSGANAIALSRCGEAFIGGWTYATDFPTTIGAFDRGAVPGTKMGFVSKLNQAGSALMFSTYITGTEYIFEGGSAPQATEVMKIAVDGSGHAYFGGIAQATDFPRTPGAYLATTEAYPVGFVGKLTTDGSSLAYSTYVPGDVRGLAVDAAGSAYVGLYNLVVKLHPAGTSAIYEFTGLPVSEGLKALAVDASGNAYAASVTYHNFVPTTPGAFQSSKPSSATYPSGFITKINPAGDAAVYATYLGTGRSMYVSGIAVDSSGSLYVTGMSDAPNGMTLPNFGSVPTLTGNQIVDGSQYALTAKLNASGSALTYAARLGGSGCNESGCSFALTRPNAIAVDSAGSAWVVGATEANNFPLVKALYSTYGDSLRRPDPFVTKISASGTTVLFSTLLNGPTVGTAGPHSSGFGSGATAVAVDSIGSVYVAGYTDKVDFPTTPGSLQQTRPSGIVSNAFVTKINETKDTTTTLASAPATGTVGTPTVLTATVTGNSPTGAVVFKDGPTSIGSAPLSGTTAQLSVSLAAGDHSLTATYGGDTHNNPSTSAAAPYGVGNPGVAPTVTLTGIADGATLIATSGSIYSGGTMNLSATPATGNRLTQARTHYPGGPWTWPLSQSEPFNVPWNMPDFIVGFYAVYATATDQYGHVGTSTPVRFVINGASVSAPSVSISAPVTGAAFTTSDTIALSASASPGSGAAITSVTYYNGGTQIGSASSSPYIVNWSGVAAGTYSVIALVVDSAGGRKLSAPIVITVTSPPPPTVSMVSPANGSTFNTPASITLVADASAASGATISKVEFFDGTTLLGTSTTFPYTYVWNTPSGGTHSITAKATDSRNVPATSAAISIQVTTPPPPTVSVTSPGAGSTFAAPASVAITATATPASGAHVTRVELYVGAQLIGTGTSGTWYVLQPGNYAITAKAFDDRGASATSNPVNVTVAGSPDEKITFLHNDLLGSPIAATNVSGTEVWTERYQPYGERLLKETESTGNRQWFTGKAHDTDTGLSYFGARYYDPIVGRFMGVDAMSFDPGDLHSFNRYGYANNNPFKFDDPDGNAPSPIDAFFTAFSGGEFLASVSLYAYGKVTGDKFLADVAGASIVSTGVGLAQDVAGLASPVPAAGAVRRATNVSEGVTKAANHAGDIKLYRRGPPDNVKALADQAAAAEKNPKIGIHGISVSTNPAPKKPGQQVRCASKAECEAAGFTVKQTGSDPHHHTMELPKPVTRETRNKVNDLFK
ncbi:hypothetical protein DSM104443_00787 [Usitatibacter rugosus]|uniref:PKD/Chitinase domain-containing protein n=1 Tax=Usitatibacter rugosus TaxID=2732067 RepID=A0A6M4GVR4_9PROT|nr:Ig-like domain-containing protein [Usitatibacter rugosus]QJR09737.1 hypothetical protein DSM104443_00787 [Usitatibacter rugosus]